MNNKLLAGIFGNIQDPWATLKPGAYPSSSGQGLIILFNNILKAVIVLAGIWSFINIIIAGYGFMAAGGNPEKVAEAWNRIWQSLLGLLVVAGSFVLAAVFGYLIFGSPTAIIRPVIYGPQ